MHLVEDGNSFTGHQLIRCEEANVDAFGYTLLVIAKSKRKVVVTLSVAGHHNLFSICESTTYKTSKSFAVH